MVITDERIRRAQQGLVSAGADAVAFEARQMVAAARSDRQLDEWLARRAQGVPLQYLLGEWEFWGLPFTVGEGVLIPQPDTEILVEQGLRAVKACPAPKVLDLCAGSGCVGIALAHERPDAEVIAVEWYDEALSYLRRNAQHNRVAVTAVKADVLQAPPDGFPRDFDLILSNPPYIAYEERGSLPREVLYEPEQALFADENGLAFYTAIAKHWLPLLKTGGTLAVEIGWKQADSVRARFSPYAAQVIRDYGGNDRVVTLVKPPY